MKKANKQAQRSKRLTTKRAAKNKKRPQEILLEDFLTVLSGKFFSSPAPGYPFAKGLGL